MGRKYLRVLAIVILVTISQVASETPSNGDSGKKALPPVGTGTKIWAVTDASETRIIASQTMNLASNSSLLNATDSKKMGSQSVILVATIPVGIASPGMDLVATNPASMTVIASSSIASGAEIGSETVPATGPSSPTDSSTGAPAKTDSEASGSEDIITDSASDGGGMETGDGRDGKSFEERNYLGIGEPKKKLGPPLTPPELKVYGKIFADAGEGSLIALAQLQNLFWPSRIPDLTTKFENIRAKNLTKLYREPGWLDQRRDDESSIAVYLGNPFSVQFRYYEGDQIKIYDFINLLDDSPMGKPKRTE